MNDSHKDSDVRRKRRQLIRKIFTVFCLTAAAMFIIGHYFPEPFAYVAITMYLASWACMQFYLIATSITRKAPRDSRPKSLGTETKQASLPTYLAAQGELLAEVIEMTNAIEQDYYYDEDEIPNQNDPTLKKTTHISFSDSSDGYAPPHPLLEAPPSINLSIAGYRKRKRMVKAIQQHLDFTCRGEEVLRCLYLSIINHEIAHLLSNNQEALQAKENLETEKYLTLDKKQILTDEEYHADRYSLNLALMGHLQYPTYIGLLVDEKASGNGGRQEYHMTLDQKRDLLLSDREQAAYQIQLSLIQRTLDELED